MADILGSEGLAISEILVAPSGSYTWIIVDKSLSMSRVLIWFLKNKSLMIGDFMYPSSSKRLNRIKVS